MDGRNAGLFLISALSFFATEKKIPVRVPNARLQANASASLALEMRTSRRVSSILECQIITSLVSFLCLSVTCMPVTQTHTSQRKKRRCNRRRGQSVGGESTASGCMASSICCSQFTSLSLSLSRLCVWGQSFCPSAAKGMPFFLILILIITYEGNSSNNDNIQTGERMHHPPAVSSPAHGDRLFPRSGLALFSSCT